MKIFPPPFLIKTHLYCAAFIMPIALMFLGTGFLLFALEIGGGYYPTHYSIQLKQPMVQEGSKLKNLVIQEMDKLELKKPNGWTKISQLNSGPGYQFEFFDGFDRIIKLVPTSDPLIATMTVKKASLYRSFVLLHPARGPPSFRLYATIIALILLVMLVTGYLLAWRLQENRKQLLYASTASVMLFIAMIVIQ